MGGRAAAGGAERGTVQGDDRADRGVWRCGARIPGSGGEPNRKKAGGGEHRGLHGDDDEHELRHLPAGVFQAGDGYRGRADRKRARGAGDPDRRTHHLRSISGAGAVQAGTGWEKRAAVHVSQDPKHGAQRGRAEAGPDGRKPGQGRDDVQAGLRSADHRREEVAGWNGPARDRQLHPGLEH